MTKKEFDEITDAEFLKFENIPENERLNIYPDLCALIYLARLSQSQLLHLEPKRTCDMIVGAEHDIMFIGFPGENLTTADAIYIARCGVHWSSECDCLALFT